MLPVSFKTLLHCTRRFSYNKDSRPCLSRYHQRYILYYFLMIPFAAFPECKRADQDISYPQYFLRLFQVYLMHHPKLLHFLSITFTPYLPVFSLNQSRYSFSDNSRRLHQNNIRLQFLHIVALNVLVHELPDYD